MFEWNCTGSLQHNYYPYTIIIGMVMVGGYLSKRFFSTRQLIFLCNLLNFILFFLLMYFFPYKEKSQFNSLYIPSLYGLEKGLQKDVHWWKVGLEWTIIKLTNIEIKIVNHNYLANIWYGILSCQFLKFDVFISFKCTCHVAWNYIHQLTSMSHYVTFHHLL